jgi:hypothetical protein
MKLLSIDVGIKNLAFCLLETIEGPMAYKILKWDVINLCGKDPVCSVCSKKSSYLGKVTGANDIYYCVTHAKKSAFKLPEPSLALKKIKKMKLSDLNDVVTEFKLVLPENAKKDEILKTVLKYMDEKMLTSVAAASANSMDLVTLGIAMQKAFDIELKDHLTTIDQIIIENQISPIANRMKTLQGMITQYFIMHDKTKIAFISAANKLKGYDIDAVDSSNTTYAERKKGGITITLDLIKEKGQNSEWLNHFKTHKKKDDLADALLQGVWFLQPVKAKK